MIRAELLTDLARPNSPFVAGAAIIAATGGIPLNASAERIERMFTKAGYTLTSDEARAIATYRRGVIDGRSAVHHGPV